LSAKFFPQESSPAHCNQQSISQSCPYKEEPGVSKKPENPATDWTSAAAIAGAAIGSAALAAALLYSSRRKEHADKAATKKPPAEPIETD
jgi:hypothetical protein